MQIVIDIPEEIYDYWQTMKSIVSDYGNYKEYMNTLHAAIADGIPLPKGHGNLIQREDAEAVFKNARKALYEQSIKERINDFQTRELMLLNAEQFVHLIQPIIKADKAESEDKE